MKKLITTVNNLSNKNFLLSSSIIVIVASMSGNIFGYLFQLLAGRYLSISDYGRLTALFSLSGIIPLVVGLFLGALPKLVAEIKDTDYPIRISKLFFTILYFSLATGFLITFALLVFQKQLGRYLNIDDLTLIQSFSLAIGTGIIIHFMAPFLQGLLRFKAFSFITILTAFLKLSIILMVMYLGLGLIHIFLGLAGATLCIGIITLLVLKKNIILMSKSLDFIDFKILVKYSLFSALGLIGINLMQNIDLIVAKHLFDEVTAGIYGSTTVIGKIIFYAASPIVIVMLPICSQKFKKGQNFVKPFALSVGIGLLISVIGTLVYSFAPHFVINLLFTERYLGAVQYLPLYSIYMIVFTLMNYLTMFLISISKFRLSTLPLIAATIQFIGIQFFAESINHIIIYSIVACTLVTIPLVIFVIKIAIENKHTED